jgi:hypothetical protein
MVTGFEWAAQDEAAVRVVVVEEELRWVLERVAQAGLAGGAGGVGDGRSGWAGCA